MRWILGIFVVSFASLTGLVAASQSDTGVEWAALHFEAKKLLMTARTIVEVDVVDTAALEHELRRIPGDHKEILPEGKNVAIRLASDLPFGQFENETIWISRSTGAALQVEKLVTGRKHYSKVQRYGEDGFYQWRYKPGSNAEEKHDSSYWSVLKTKFVPFSPKAVEGRVVSDSASLLYQIAVARLDRPGAQLKTVINVRGELVEVVFTAQNLVKSTLKWTDSADGKQRSRKVSRLRRVSAKARALTMDSNAAEVDIGFMGIRGDLEIFVLEGDGTPAMIVGSSKGIGEVRVKLTKRFFRPGI